MFLLPREKRSSAAFTILELLAVVAILATLVIMLLPAAGGLRDRARASKATGNIKSLLLAQNMYANDNNGRFTPPFNSDGIVWQAKLLPYLANMEPTEENFQKVRAAGGGAFEVPELNTRDKNNKYLRSIALNWSINSGGSTGSWYLMRLNVPRPQSIILLGEMKFANTDTMVPLGYTGDTPALRRQNGTKALMGFVDGHVEALEAERLKYTSTDKDTNSWRWW